MRIAIFSDIHGNIHAFEKVYKRIKKEKCDLHFFLGDICGYYFHQNEVIDILREIPNIYCISGNHDVLFLKALENDCELQDYSDRFGLSFNFLKETITPVNLDFLRLLRRENIFERLKVAMFHGSPWSPDEYVYPQFPMGMFDTLSYKVVFLGHTHRIMDFRGKNIRVINPGSAGQPRDGGWPSYAVYEMEDDVLEFKRVPYNIKALKKEIHKRRDTNPYLVDVLDRIGS